MKTAGSRCGHAQSPTCTRAPQACTLTPSTPYRKAFVCDEHAGVHRPTGALGIKTDVCLIPHSVGGRGRPPPPASLNTLPNSLQVEIQYDFSAIQRCSKCVHHSKTRISLQVPQQGSPDDPRDGGDRTPLQILTTPPCPRRITLRVPPGPWMLATGQLLIEQTP